MKIIVNDLREHMWKNRLTAKSLVDELNLLQAAVFPGKRPITRNFVYSCLNGHPPKRDNLYLLAAILKVHPKKLCTLSYDDEQYEKNLATYSKLHS